MQVKKIRVTNGTFIKTRRAFQVIDDYHAKANSHRLLAGAWIGTSEFREVDNYIEDVDQNAKSIAWADCDSDHETQEPPHTSGSICSLAPSRRRICSNEVDNSQSSRCLSKRGWAPAGAGRRVQGNLVCRAREFVLVSRSGLEPSFAPSTVGSSAWGSAWMAQADYRDGHMRHGQTGTERMGGARRVEACKPPLIESYEETKRPAGVLRRAKLLVKQRQRLCALLSPGLAAFFFILS